MLDPRTFPRPPSISPTASTITIRAPGPSGPLLASTTAALRLLETFHPPTYYLPRADVRAPLARSATPETWCEWKGRATYWDVLLPGTGGGGEWVRGRAWSYEEPRPGWEAIRGRVSFYVDERWECRVDGERVEAQPGDFYGGWMTGDVLREGVKGAQGTRGW